MRLACVQVNSLSTASLTLGSAANVSELVKETVRVSPLLPTVGVALFVLTLNEEKMGRVVSRVTVRVSVVVWPAESWAVKVMVFVPSVKLIADVLHEVVPVTVEVGLVVIELTKVLSLLVPARVMEVWLVR